MKLKLTTDTESMRDRENYELIQYDSQNPDHEKYYEAIQQLTKELIESQKEMKVVDDSDSIEIDEPPEREDTIFLVVYKEDDEVAAIASIDPVRSDSVASLETLYVREQDRGQGLAKDLISHVIEYAKSLGKQHLITGVMSNNPALRLYESVGFQNYHQAMYLELGK